MTQSGMTPSSASGFSSSSSGSALYPPEPPTILPEDYTDNGRPTSSSSSRIFLNSTPAEGSTIEVHTMPHEYQIHIKLPGFTWDGITLATKRKKVLHVVADRWDKTGGHFERRVAFGYDADLTQVKADFNGDMLRIGIPRRAASVVLMQPTRPAPIGRHS